MRRFLSKNRLPNNHHARRPALIIMLSNTDFVAFGSWWNASSRRLSSPLVQAIDEWRQFQPDIPPRATAARRLIEDTMQAGGDRATLWLSPDRQGAGRCVTWSIPKQRGPVPRCSWRWSSAEAPGCWPRRRRRAARHRRIGSMAATPTGCSPCSGVWPCVRGEWPERKCRSSSATRPAMTASGCTVASPPRGSPAG
jgi:hypothetical protein